MDEKNPRLVRDDGQDSSRSDRSDADKNRGSMVKPTPDESLRLLRSFVQIEKPAARAAIIEHVEKILTEQNAGSLH